jgi:hypothetical protein
MKVKELIEILKTYPPEQHIVLINEGGIYPLYAEHFDNINDIDENFYPEDEELLLIGE